MANNTLTQAKNAKNDEYNGNILVASNPMTDSDVSFAKKRFARDLKILVAVQVIALCIAGLGVFLFGSDIVPNYPDWDTVHSLCGVLGLCGIIVFVVAAFWGSVKPAVTNFLPYRIQLYASGTWGILSVFVILGLFYATFHPFEEPILTLIPICVFPFYSIISQFLIARWLAKEAKDAAM